MNPLAQRALVGLARAPAAPLAADLPAEIAALVATAPPDRALLLAAGALALYRTAGFVPVPSPRAAYPCNDDNVRHCTSRQAGLLEALWDDAALFEVACARLVRAGRVLPPGLLTRALDIAAGRRAAVAPLLGPRGRWLAALRPRWSWVVGARADPEALAATVADGRDRAARVAALRSLREHDPERARALVAAGWRGEQADVRAALLGALEVGLGPSDEAFVAACLRDRARAVRQGAQALLLRLPGSGFGARMAARAAALVTRCAPASDGTREQTLRRLARLFAGRAAPAEGLRLTLVPPPELPEDWRADGIDGAAPGAGADKPTAWACEVLALTPPAVWLAPLDPTDAAAVLAQLPSDEPALVLALARAVAAFDVRPLARPLGRWLAMSARAGDRSATSAAPGDREVEAAIALLTPHMTPLDDAEATAMLQRSEGLAHVRYDQTLALAAHPWSIPMGQAFCDALNAWLRSGARLDGPYDHPFLARGLEDAALALPDPLVAPLLALLHEVLASTPGSARQRVLERCFTRLRLRARLIAEIPLE